MEVAFGVDLRGRVALITGASSGIGLETARALAAAGADLILCLRDAEKGSEIAAAIRREDGHRVEIETLDLCDFGSVHRAARAIASRHAAIDFFIANAGVSKTELSHQADGIDIRFAGNHLGHFLLANLLHPHMARRGARLVVLSSAAHRGRALRFDDLAWTARAHDEFDAYGESKTANILFAIEANRRWQSDGIIANAVLPGTIMTGLQRHHGDALKRRLGFIDANGDPAPEVKTIAQGAATTVWAAVAAELEGRGGLVLEDCAPSRRHSPGMHLWCGYDPDVLDPVSAQRLWSVSTQMLAACGQSVA